MNRSTGALTTVAQFTGSTGAVKGGSSSSTLASDGAGNMWGMETNSNTIFKINTTSGAFTTVTQFTGNTGNTGAVPGQIPTCGLTSDGEGNLWGTTLAGGSAGLGTIFKIKTANNAFSSPMEVPERRQLSVRADFIKGAEFKSSLGRADPVKVAVRMPLQTPGRDQLLERSREFVSRRSEKRTRAAKEGQNY